MHQFESADPVRLGLPMFFVGLMQKQFVQVWGLYFSKYILIRILRSYLVHTCTEAKSDGVGEIEKRLGLHHFIVDDAFFNDKGQ